MVSKLDQLIETYHSLEFESKIDESIEVCKEILKINPNLMEYRENLASSYYTRNEYEKSINQYNEIIEMGGDKDFSLLMIALSYVKLKRIEKAFETIEKTEDEENYFFNYLRIYKELNEYGKAIEYGEQALDLNPENVWALHIMSEIYEEIDDMDRSLFYLNELANVVPQFRHMEILKLYSLEKYDELIETFEKDKETGIFNDDLENENFNFIIGVSYYEVGKPYESLKYLLESDRLKEEVDKKMLIAKNYLNINKFDNAHCYLKQALEMDDLDETCLFLITETSYYRQEYIQAIEYANKLLNNYQYNKVFLVLAAVYLDLGEDETAFENIKLGRKLMMDDVEEDFQAYLLLIARTLSQSGLSKRAENIYNKLQQRYPNFPPIYIERAKHYKRVGKEELAQKDFKNYNEARDRWKRHFDEFIGRMKYI